jgi:hypothetical protein
VQAEILSPLQGSGLVRGPVSQGNHPGLLSVAPLGLTNHLRPHLNPLHPSFGTVERRLFRITSPLHGEVATASRVRFGRVGRWPESGPRLCRRPGAASWDCYATGIPFVLIADHTLRLVFSTVALRGTAGDTPAACRKLCRPLQGSGFVGGSGGPRAITLGCFLSPRWGSLTIYDLTSILP